MPINNITQTVSTIPAPPHRGVDVQTQFVIKQEDFQDHLQGTTVSELNALKTQINTTVTGINDAVTNVNTKAGEASTSASQASASATTATTKAGEASTSASQASASATKAKQWADNNYNVQVETGKYSAKHWSTVAQNAVNNKIDKVISTDNAVVRFNGTTGEVQNSGVVIDDADNITQRASRYKRDSGNVTVATIDASAGVSFNFNEYTGGGFIFYSASAERMRITSSGNLLVGTTTDNGGDKLQVNGSISALPPSFGIQQQINNHRKLYCFYTGNLNQNRLKLTISGDTIYLSFVLNIVYSNIFSATNQSAIREYSFKRLAFADTTNFSEIGTGFGGPVTVISSNIVTGGYEVVLGFNAGGYPQFDIEIVNHQHESTGTITGEFLTV